jgi:predicted enzyme related to lactoylglutathione lyase
MELRYIIIKINDMDRATNFYNKLTGKQPEMDGNRMAKYRFNGIKIGLYDPEADGENIKTERGDSVIPAFGAQNYTKELQRIKELTDIKEEREVDGHRWFTFTDSEGNLLEIHER